MNPSIRKAIVAIREDDWIDIAYPDGGQAQVVETGYVTGGGSTKRAERHVRLIVRRTRLGDGSLAHLWPDWRHHAFITKVDLPTVAVDQFHRDHATVELAIGDLNKAPGWSTALPGGSSPTRLAGLCRARTQPLATSPHLALVLEGRRGG